MAITQTGTAHKPFKSPKAKTRALWLAIHKWIGLILLVPMAALGFTGAALVWPSATETLVYPERALPSAAPSTITLQDDSFNEAQVALAEYGPIAAMRFGTAGEPVLVGTPPVLPPKFGLGPPTRMAAYVDHVSGEVLAVTPSTGDFMWFMHATHGHLLLKGIGRPVVGIFGFVLLASAISGLYLWWPAKGRFWSGFKWQKREGVVMNLHKQSGVWLSLILILEAFTGVWISYPSFFAQLVEPGIESGGGEHGGGRGGGGGETLANPNRSFAQALTRARGEYDANPVSITAPTSETDHWQVMLIGSNGPAVIEVEDSSDDISVEYRRDDAGTSVRVAHIMEAVHYGNIGFVWDFLVFLSGIAMFFLSLSGIWIWGIAKIAKNRRTKNRSAKAAA